LLISRFQNITNTRIGVQTAGTPQIAVKYTIFLSYSIAFFLWKRNQSPLELNPFVDQYFYRPVIKRGVIFMFFQSDFNQCFAKPNMKKA